MDQVWVDRWLDSLDSQALSATRRAWALFAPVARFYALLETGEDHDLQSATDEVSRHLGLPTQPSVTYEWGLKMQPQVAGQIHLRSGQRSHIQIPLFYVGKPHALGGILAHELTHEFLACAGIACTGDEEGELLTDLASIARGLGRLVLNGSISMVAPQTGEAQILGYLSPELKAYAYRRVNQERSVPDAKARELLTPEALRWLK